MDLPNIFVQLISQSDNVILALKINNYDLIFILYENTYQTVEKAYNKYCSCILEYSQFL